MKKIYLMFAAAAALFAVSCVKDDVYDGPLPEVEVKQTLVINEVCPQTKQIEFYNYGKEEIDLGGCSMTKDGGDKWDMPSVKLPAGKVIVFTAKSTDPADGPSFGLSATKGFLLELFNSKGESIDLLDNSSTAENFTKFDESDDPAKVQTLGRKSDGDALWVIFMPGSIGEDNSKGTYLRDWGTTAPVDEGGVVLNELYGAAAADKDKFIELYNTSGKEVTITGYTIQKDGSLAWTAPEGTKIAANGFLAIIGAKGSTPDGFSSGFSAKKSVLVQLLDEKGTVIDTFQRGEEGTGWGNTSLEAVTGSWSRVPDGSGKFKITDTPTPNAANSTTGTDDPTIVQ